VVSQSSLRRSTNDASNREVGLRGKYFQGFDGLRALAVALVIFHHVFYAESHGAAPAFWPAPLLLLSAAGNVGVDLFFVLSGFLITGNLLREKGESLAFSSYFSGFLVRRALRILPLYVLFLGVVAVIGPPSAPLAALPQALAYAPPFFIQNWVYAFMPEESLTLSHDPALPTWSLAIEEQFYLLWPVAVWFLGRRKLVVLAVSLTVLAALLRPLGLAVVGEEFVYMSTVTRMDGIAFGCLAYFLYEQRDQLAASYKKYVPLLFGAACAVILLEVLVMLGGFTSLTVAFGRTLVSLVFAAGVLALQFVPSKSIVFRVLGSYPLVMMGKMSFGIYLIHALVVYAFERVLPDTLRSTPSGAVAYLASVLILTGVLSVLSFRYEQRWLSLKDRLAPRLARPTLRQRSVYGE
jgi:peptidoglycan/LPS O-acetylase OafA/YrhL